METNKIKLVSTEFGAIAAAIIGLEFKIDFDKIWRGLGEVFYDNQK